MIIKLKITVGTIMKIYRKSSISKIEMVGTQAGCPVLVQSARLVVLMILIFSLMACSEDNDNTNANTETNTTTVVLQAPKPIRPIPMDIGCVTPECHADYSSAKHIHEPVQKGTCSACHQPDSGDHTYQVKKDGNELCLTCHDTGKNGIYRHSPIDDPGCMGCHDPHVSETAGLLHENSVEKQCETCHEKILKRINHEPFDQGFCTSCHDPHEADNNLFLTGGEESEHCFTCHDKVKNTLASEAFDHAGIAYQCSACHSAHSTDSPNLLKGTPEELCSACHAEKMAAMKNSSVGHDAVLKGERCFQCHAPHGSDHPKLLRAGDQTATCLQCHDKEITTRNGRKIRAMAKVIQDSQFQHGPVQAGDCASCHTVHGGSERALLMDRYTTKFFTTFDLKNFALCFDCHTDELVTSQYTESATEFRDGKVNLHYLHINREKRGSTCRSCHAVHGSNQPRHIAQTVAYEGSDWLMPIRFELTPTGGTCAPGCHEPMSYSRKTALIENAEPVPSDEPGGDL